MRLFIVIFWVLLSFMLASCSGGLSHYQQTPSYVQHHGSDNQLARSVARLRVDMPESHSAVYPLTDGIAAFVARVSLIRAAETSIDLQYYIYRGDETGSILTAALIEAADRGVRVRMLLDDLPNKDGDQVLLLLNAHPNIEVRLFNPFVNRRFRGLELAGSFERINRRMHNKSLTIDNVATVVGGRNIGDEYFAASTEIEFGDFDLLAIGPVVPQVSEQFDLYWNHQYAVLVAELSSHKINEQQFNDAHQKFLISVADLGEREYVVRLKQSTMLRDLQEGSLEWFSGPARAVYDLPSKMDQPAAAEQSFMVQQMASVWDGLGHQVLFISPYFVPMDDGVSTLLDMVARGIDVTVVTNSLAATDVVAVHGGYQKYRKVLLAGGVKLYESKVNPSHKPSAWKGSSRASLHAKTFVLDERKVYVGSFNIDPRSAALNTEMGLLIDSPALAKKLLFGGHDLSDTAYRLSLDVKNDQLLWFDDATGEQYSSEPDASIWRRLGAAIMSWLPIESML